MRSLIFGKDKTQAIRISRFLMSATAYVLSFFLVCLSYWLGYLEGWVVAVVAVAICINCCVLYAWIRSGLNLRMADPSLTMIQMFVATLVIMVSIYNANHVRGPFLIIYLIVFLFGIFRLNTRQFMALTVFVLLSYGFVIGMLVQYHPDKINLNEDLLQWMALAALLPFFGFVGGYISSLRLKLRNSHNELGKAMTVIHEMAIHDELTGLYNRHQLMELLRIEKGRADRGGQLFCLMILDIDHFKKVNDSFGHLVGDKVLKITADTVQGELRTPDFCGRYGGEEFVLMMGQTTKDGAMVLAERLRQSVEAIRFPELTADFRVTISLGIAEYRLGEDISETISRADKALYRAKDAGRNHVECA
jgi:diguanylate cyclase (GGDEF)-like protein